MKATIPELKKKVKSLAGNTGLVLSKSNPYWANSEQIRYLTEALEQVIHDGDANPQRRMEVTEAQKTSLYNWIDSMKQTYLR